MNYVKSVFDISEKFTQDPSYVFIDYNKVEGLGKIISNDVNIRRFEPSSPTLSKDEIIKECYLQLLGGSINYCYWHGKYNIRPNECSSEKMFNIILKATSEYSIWSRDFISSIKNDLTKGRFPLLEERFKHIDEVAQNGKNFIDTIVNFTDADISDLMEYILSLFPGFASDIFLKRASLFFLMLYRKFGWFENSIDSLYIPADYQVPKLFNFFGCLQYKEQLYSKIHTHQLIDKGSLMECEIRASTIIMAQRLCEITGLNISDIDSYFWLKRKEYNIPFHLTITTDY